MKVGEQITYDGKQYKITGYDSATDEILLEEIETLKPKEESKPTGFKSKLEELLEKYSMKPSFAGGTGGSEKTKEPSSYEDWKKPLKKDDPSKLNYFYQKIGSVMKDNKFDRYKAGFRSGKLNTTKLWKVQADSDRVFKRKTECQNKEYSVLISIDESGSMYNSYADTDRIRLAARTATTLIRGLEKNNINFAVLGYNEHLVVHKKFDKKMTSKQIDKLEQDIIYRPRDGGGGCNHDYSAIKEAHKILAKATGKKIFFLFSDGAPACGCWGETAEKEENIPAIKAEYNKICMKYDVIALGMDIEIKNVYPGGVKVASNDEFMNVVLNKLAKLIQRG